MKPAPRWLILGVALGILLPRGSAADEESEEYDAQVVEAEGSLWEIVDSGVGVPLTEEAVLASEVLAEERFAEQGLLDSTMRVGEPDTTLYLSPEDVVVVLMDGDTPVNPQDYDIPLVLNADVKRWMDYYQNRGRRYYSRWLERRSRYSPLITAELEAAGLPQDILYLAMIESGFSTQARSHASAVGLWQFIATTGRAYGLRIDYWVDERRDPVASTAAAVAFLRDLYDTFDDWYLAWSGYNTGAGRVQAAINAQDSRDYWELVEHGRLHPETANYVPKILAAAILGKNLEAYGFEVSSPQAPLDFVLVEVTGSVSLDVIAQCAGVDRQAIDALNGALLRGATPPHSTTRVYLPAGTEETFLAAYENMPDSSRASYHRHTVESGESLSAIAAQYEVPASVLAEFNRIENPHLIRVGMSLVVPVPGLSGEAGDVASVAPSLREVTVGPGDSLLGIADRLGVGVDQLVAWNQLDNPNRIQVGQRLMVPTTGTAQVQGAMEYEVRGGDTLYGIALEQGCTVSELKQWNGLGGPTIHPGQTLRVRAP